MKAWRVTNIKSGHYTESTQLVVIKREIVNAYGITTVKEVDINRVLDMAVGEVSTIGDLEISCFEAQKKEG